MQAGIVHRQYCQMKTLLVFGRIAIKSAPGRHVRLNAKDWLNTSPLGSFIKIKDATHCPVVSHGSSLHAKLLDRIDEVVYLRQPVKHRVISMVVEVHKIRRL